MLAILSFNSCATNLKMELRAVASLDQKTDPYGAIVSEKTHMVSVSFYEEIPYIRDNAIFNIIIENGGEEPITIGYENISVIFEGHDKKQTVKKLKILSKAEFMQDVEYEYNKILMNYLSQIGRKDDIRAYSLSEGVPKPDVFITIFPPMTKNYLLTKVPKVEATNIKIKTLREILPDLILKKETLMPRDSRKALMSCRTNEIPHGIKGDFKINVFIDDEKHGFTFARK